MTIQSWSIICKKKNIWHILPPLNSQVFIAEFLYVDIFDHLSRWLALILRAGNAVKWNWSEAPPWSGVWMRLLASSHFHVETLILVIVHVRHGNKGGTAGLGWAMVSPVLPQTQKVRDKSSPRKFDGLSWHYFYEGIFFITNSSPKKVPVCRDIVVSWW